MGIVINLDERRKKKKENPVTDVIRDSLDNDAVMRRYGIEPKEISFDERLDNIKKTIARINSTLADLHSTGKEKTK